MTAFTEHYELLKPSTEDYYDIQDFNENMDTLDTALHEQALETTGIGEKLGTAADGGNDTIFGKLNGLASLLGTGIQLVKSIQRVTYDVPPNQGNGICKLSTTVNPERCIVLMERLWDDTADGCAWVDYTLSATELSLSHGRYSVDPGVSMGYWIVEFY